jgi:SAM-dependent methyltransferase
MEAVSRKPYQGVFNIVRFNWHFYVIAFAVVFALFLATTSGGMIVFWVCFSIATGIGLSTIVSLSVSYYVYDVSDLYEFNWLKQIIKTAPDVIVNIHAGFDETSIIIKKIFPTASLSVFDFYDPDKHTEISIERARRAYPSYDGTVKINTDLLPLSNESADIIFNIFALHEIRSPIERTGFLKAQARVLKAHGKCVIVEHMRDVPNFLAYNIGFMHFFPEREWNQNIFSAGLEIESKFKITPFISVLILKRNGNTP